MWERRNKDTEWLQVGKENSCISVMKASRKAILRCGAEQGLSWDPSQLSGSRWRILEQAHLQALPPAPGLCTRHSVHTAPMTLTLHCACPSAWLRHPLHLTAYRQTWVLLITEGQPLPSCLVCKRGSAEVLSGWLTCSTSVSLLCPDIKESACNVGLTSIPGLERAPGEGSGYSLPFYCLENSVDRGAWWAYRPWGHRDTTEQLSRSTSFTFYLSKVNWVLSFAECFWRIDKVGC